MGKLIRATYRERSLLINLNQATSLYTAKKLGSLEISWRRRKQSKKIKEGNICSIEKEYQVLIKVTKIGQDKCIQKLKK